MNPAAEVQTSAAVPVPRHVMQTIAHELRQPLSAIESTAYYLGLVMPAGNGRAVEHVARLRQLVEQSNWILSCGLQLTDYTPPAPEQVDLEEFITETVAAAMTPASPKPLLDLAGDLPPVLLDPGRGHALINNLLMLFRQISEDVHRIHVKTEPGGDFGDGGRVVLELSVDVPGRSSEAALGPGAALCLSSVRHTVSAHDGDLTVTVDPHQGVRLRIALPAC